MSSVIFERACKPYSIPSLSIYEHTLMTFIELSKFSTQYILFFGSGIPQKKAGKIGTGQVK